MADSNSSAKKELLNSEDLKGAMKYAVTRGESTDSVKASDFQILFDIKAKAMGLVEGNNYVDQAINSDLGKAVTSRAASMLDADGDGAVTTKDFEVFFERNMAFIDRNKSTIDAYFPLAGQCCFGVACGWVVGYSSRSLMRYKIPILLLGFGAYTGMQYLAQEQFINQQLLLAEFQRRMAQIIDVNSDGVINRDDMEDLLERKMAIINQKLGAGGFAPGIAGYVTFSLGMLRAMTRKV